MYKFENERADSYIKLVDSGCSATDMIFYFIKVMERRNLEYTNNIYRMENGNEYEVIIQRRNKK